MKMNKKIVIRLMILLAAILIAYGGYDMYSHYRVIQFYQSIDEGDTEGAMTCIEKMPDVNKLEMCLPLYMIARTFTGGTSQTGYPLYYAVSHDADISIIRALLEKGADPNRIDLGFLPHYPLHYVCTHPSKDMYEKTMLLADYGVDTNTGYLYIPVYFTEFSEETRESMFLTLVYLWENGAEEWHYVGTKDERTALHEAARWMSTEYLEEFYHNEKRPMEYLLNTQDVNGETPLFSAVREGMFDNCRFLIAEGADISVRNNEGKTVYDIAVELGYEECIEILESAMESDGENRESDVMQGQQTESGQQEDKKVLIVEDEDVRDNPVFSAFIDKKIVALDKMKEENRYIYEYFANYGNGIDGIHYMAGDLNQDEKEELLVFVERRIGGFGDLLVFAEENGELIAWEKWENIMTDRLPYVYYCGSGMFMMHGGAGISVGHYTQEGTHEPLMNHYIRIEESDNTYYEVNVWLQIYENGKETENIEYQCYYDSKTDEHIAELETEEAERGEQLTKAVMDALGEEKAISVGSKEYMDKVETISLAKLIG